MVSIAGEKAVAEVPFMRPFSYYEWLDAATKARDEYLEGKISKEETLKTLDLKYKIVAFSDL